MTATYYKRRTWDDKVAIFKRVRAGGDRQIASGMSEVFASLIVRLLNEDETRKRVVLEDVSRPGEGQG